MYIPGLEFFAVHLAEMMRSGEHDQDTLDAVYCRLYTLRCQAEGLKDIAHLGGESLKIFRQEQRCTR